MGIHNSHHLTLTQDGSYNSCFFIFWRPNHEISMQFHLIP